VDFGLRRNRIEQEEMIKKLKKRTQWTKEMRSQISRMKKRIPREMRSQRGKNEGRKKCKANKPNGNENPEREMRSQRGKNEMSKGKKAKQKSMPKVERNGNIEAR
jgi:hypothetical protein